MSDHAGRCPQMMTVGGISAPVAVRRCVLDAGHPAAHQFELTNGKQLHIGAGKDRE